MTNSYQGISDGRTNTGRRETPDYAAGARRNNALQKQSLESYFSALNLNANTAIKDAQNNGSNLKQLGDLSKTLSDGLVERQKGINENEMLRGINDAYMNGVSEGELTEADDVAKIHATAEKQDLELISKVDTFAGERIRKSSSWYEYGLHIGKIQNGSRSYAGYMANAKASGPITINGREISPNTTNPSERSAWVAYHRSQFLAQYSQYKPALLSKHLFPSIQKHDQASSMEWGAEQSAVIKKNREVELKDEIYAALKGNDFDKVLDYQLKYANEYGDVGKARRAAAKIMEDLVDSGDLTRGEFQDWLNHRFLHRGSGDTDVETEYGRDYAGVMAALDRKDDKDFKISERDYKLKERAFEENFNRLTQEASDAGEPLTEEDIEALKRRAGTFNTRYMDDYKTREARDVETIRERLYLLRSSNGRGYLIPQDLEGAPLEIITEFGQQVKEDASIAEGSTNLQGKAAKIIDGYIKGRFVLNAGEVPATHKGLVEEMKMRAELDYQRKYTAEMRTGKYATAEDAHEAAMENVKKEIEKIGNGISGEDKVGTDSMYLSADIQESNDGQVNLRLARIDVKKNIDLYSQILSGSNQALVELQENVINNSSQIPLFYQLVAEDIKNMTGWDLANAQLKASGYEKGLEKPPAETLVDGLSPRVRNFLRNNHSPSRTYQGMITGDASERATVLSAIASVESAGYGHYDAYNKGGADGGYTAIDPGNSREGVGKLDIPISEMTLGDIMNRQNRRQLFAVGRYQFIPSTFKEVFNYGGFSPDDVFDQETQDRFAILRGRQRISWHGQNSETGIINEWRGLKFASQAERLRILKYLNGLPQFETRNIHPGLLK
tara:strand:- start:4072 stop:6597 length:2526 start_codon:yes stop_codon:yes gene_type:complete